MYRCRLALGNFSSVLVLVYNIRFVLQTELFVFTYGVPSFFGVDDGCSHNKLRKKDEQIRDINTVPGTLPRMKRKKKDD